MSLPSSTLVKAAPWALTALLFVLWELICVGFALPDYLLPAPTAVWASGQEFAGAIMQHATQTLLTTLAGFALAVAVGLALGLAVGADETHDVSGNRSRSRISLIVNCF